jgi:hypothetical protein
VLARLVCLLLLHVLGTGALVLHLLSMELLPLTQEVVVGVVMVAEPLALVGWVVEAMEPHLVLVPLELQILAGVVVVEIINLEIMGVQVALE